MYRLGLANIQGSLGLTRNVRDGNKWLKRSSDAASPEYPHALHELGLLHEKGLEGIIFKDGQYSVQLYTRAASELGYAPSAYRLGECFEFGYLGCEKDTTSAVFYYLIAAKQGNADACFALSALYLTGDETKNIKPSEEKAFYWASVAAEKGIAKAEFAMGYFTEVGIGRTVNIQEAANWYQKAASQGDEKAKKRLSNLRSRPTPTYNKIPPSNSTTMVAATGEA
jgi:TPR repeat protein